MSLSDAIAAVGAFGQEQFAAGAASRQAEVDGLKADLSTLQATFDAYRESNPETVAAPSVRAGVYRSGNNADTDDWAAGWPLSASTFYFNFGARVGNQPRVEAALAAGRDVILAWDSKISKGVYAPLSEFADGSHDDALTRWRDDLNALLVKYPDRSIYLAPFHEVELDKRNPADTVASAIAAQHHVAEFMHADGSQVKVAYWAASGVRQAYYGDPADFDLATADIYYRGISSHGLTMTQVYQAWRNTLDTVGWGGVPRGITETGIVVNKFSSAEQIAWWQSAPDAITAHDLRVWVTFMDDRDLNYVPTDASVKAALRDVYAELAN